MQKSTIVLLVLALASAGVSAGLWMELRAERALNAELSDRLNAVAATPIVAQPAARLPAEPPAATPVEAAIAPAPVVAPAEPAAAKPTRAAQASYEDWQARQRRLMSDPKYREAFREQQRLQLAQRRENFIRLLGLTPVQADAVIELSLDRQMNWQDRMQAGTNTNSPEEVQQRRESMAAADRAYEAKVRELLGESKAAQMQTYMESRGTRMQVDRFRTQLTGADSLRDDQVEPLITALHQEQAQMQKEMQEFQSTQSVERDLPVPQAAQRQYAERQTEAMKAAHKRMHSAASGLLSSTQLEQLDAMLKRDLERHEAQLRMSRIQSKLDPPQEAAGSSN
jgi:hypothetical protein